MAMVRSSCLAAVQRWGSDCFSHGLPSNPSVFSTALLSLSSVLTAVPSILCFLYFCLKLNIFYLHWISNFMFIYCFQSFRIKKICWEEKQKEMSLLLSSYCSRKTSFLTLVQHHDRDKKKKKTNKYLIIEINTMDQMNMMLWKRVKGRSWGGI